MATTYLQLTNELLRELNEVVLTSSNFSSAIGIQAHAKDCINRAYDDIYVITSEFHYNRANKIAEKILDTETKWILGDEKLNDSYYWEKIHIKNVEDDINKALYRYIIFPI